MNKLPKYVVSHSLERAEWALTTILSGDTTAWVEEVKRQPGRELQICGSAQLGQSLLAARQIDKVRLVIASVVVSRGRRLFREGGAPAHLRSLRNDTTPPGLAIHVYESAGRSQDGIYGAA